MSRGGLEWDTRVPERQFRLPLKGSVPTVNAVVVTATAWPVVTSCASQTRYREPTPTGKAFASSRIVIWRGSQTRAFAQARERESRRFGVELSSGRADGLRPAPCDQVNGWPGRRRRDVGSRRRGCRLAGACSCRASCLSHERSCGVGSAPASSASNRASSRLANSSGFGSGTTMLDVPTVGWSTGQRQTGVGAQAGAGALRCFAVLVDGPAGVSAALARGLAV